MIKEFENLFITSLIFNQRILKNIIHACDIGNPAQKYDRYIYWSALVTHEFDYQVKFYINE